MTKWMISFLSIVAVASMFSGCGSEGSASTGSGIVTTGTTTNAEPAGDYNGEGVSEVRGLSDLPAVPALPES